jgi:hypothetical protein
VVSTAALKIKVFWDVTPHCRASVSWHSFKMSGYVNTVSHPKTLESSVQDSFPGTSILCIKDDVNRMNANKVQSRTEGQRPHVITYA